jgi:hypothetical protein
MAGPSIVSWNVEGLQLPGAIQPFLADFESLDVRHQKAQLQAILKSAYGVRDPRIELEFRG